MTKAKTAATHSKIVTALRRDDWRWTAQDTADLAATVTSDRHLANILKGCELILRHMDQGVAANRANALATLAATYSPDELLDAGAERKSTYGIWYAADRFARETRRLFLAGLRAQVYKNKQSAKRMQDGERKAALMIEIKKTMSAADILKEEWEG